VLMGAGPARRRATPPAAAVVATAGAQPATGQ
jgi:hypothetical protein